jgi:hypothetical protein
VDHGAELLALHAVYLLLERLERDAEGLLDLLDGDRVAVDLGKDLAFSASGLCRAN